ncbi:sigma-70 region 2 [Leptospira ryugenii]|uniref:Sigma-70 region 2 n=1 Tax=Leptospira ryugenii TaxID=1917863 RepID=A0A2P2E1I0_9LEPT|nr:sigma-70 family RNA polymerase sigma factor [Leptospira ryugenii]GBF50748.1 sigma-70 region 2 [Leptospira ryugenii]
MSSSQFEEILKENHDRLYLYALFLCHDKVEAEDLLQETYIKILQAEQSFQSEKGSFITWAKRILKNHFLDLERKKKLRIVDLESNMDHLTSPRHEISEFDEGHIVQLRDCIEKLEETDRSIIHMKIFKAMTLDEMAKSLGLNRRTISRRYSKILVDLRDIFLGKL